MPTSWVVKLSRAEEAEEAVLLHLTPKGTHDLDLDILATEGEVVYKGKVRQRKINDLRAKNYDGPEAEWTAILRYILVSKQGTDISDEQKSNLETVGSVNEKKSVNTLTITFRNKIEGITQRLGSIELTETEDEISLFDWTALAVDQKDSLEEEVVSLSRKSESDKATIASLQTQLADLVKAKSEHENQLLSKFVLLLNEKKLRIRNQQRIISSAKVDKGKLRELRLTLEGEPTTSRTSRVRKRDTKDGVEDQNASDSSDGFERVDVDMDRVTTPESETASEDNGSVDIPDSSPPPSANTRGARKAAVNSTSPPPRRDLPFVKKGGKGKKEQKPGKEKTPETLPGIDEETASEDDEL